MSSEPETPDPPESSPPLFRGFRDRLNKTGRGPFLAFVWLLLGTGLFVSVILFLGLACKTAHH
jgi:hypothetical protein